MRRLFPWLGAADEGGDGPVRSLNPDPSRRGDLLACVFLLLCTCGLHAHGLTLGFWFDDHNHLELCRTNGFADLAGGNRFDWTHKIFHVWWAKQETGWAYYRPVTVAMRVGLLRLFGLNPLPFHLVHLGLFSLSALLFYGLLRRLGWGLRSSCAAGFFFVLHPVNAVVASWLANDTSVLVGLSLLAALWLFHASALSSHRQAVLLAAVFLCYAIAMLSRESGVMVGPLLVLFDWLWAGRRALTEQGGPTVSAATWRRRVALYAGLATEALVYLSVRAWSLGPGPGPRSPYFHWPSEPGFCAWLPYKILNDLVCVPLGLPLMPIVDVSWWQARPLTTAAAALLVLALAAAFLYPLRRSRAMWGVLGGVVLVQAPTTLAFSAPFNYYLATAGCAVLLAMWARRVGPTRPRLVAGTLAGLVGLYLFGLWGGAWTLHSAAATERLVREGVAATRPDKYPAKTRLFFINLPFFAAEIGPALRNAASRPDLEVYPLTFSPDLFFPDTQATVEQEDDHTLLVRSEGPGFFAGGFGEQVELAWFGGSRKDLSLGPMPVRPAAGPMPFHVEVVQADDRGVRALRFVFDRPLDDPGSRFFFSTPWAGAEQLMFRHDSEVDGADEEIAAAVPASTPQEQRDLDRLGRMEIAWRRIRQVLAAWPF